MTYFIYNMFIMFLEGFVREDRAFFGTLIKV